MKIFITGGTGFIGTQVVKRLSQTEHKLYCLVRKESNISEIEKFGPDLIIGDVTNKASIYKGMAGCDWVIHLANIYSFWEPDKSIYKEVNVKGTQNAMECALETGVSKIVHLSTLAVYGKPLDSPFTEESSIGPTRFSEYARTKYEGELIAWELYTKKKLPLIVLYPGGVLGPNDPKTSGQYIKSIIFRKIPATAFNNSILTWVYVKDVANAIINALEKKDNIGEKYFIGEHKLTFHKFNNIISEISNVPLPKINLSNNIAFLFATLLTAVANCKKKPPLFSMAIDQIKTMKEGCIANGSKAKRELNITYTPIKLILENAIKSFKEYT